LIDPLNILITNHNLCERAGSELYVRDLATALLARGHRPVVYSPTLGRVALEIRSASVPVIDDLAGLAASPDVIHGHHHLETMTAALQFPGVPAVYVCHGWLPFEEAPPRFPRILQYVAVDDTCRDRLLCEAGIPDERIRVLLNFVDLDRFPARAPLPAQPRRGLLFCNENGPHGALVREACAAGGIALDAVGLGHGSSVLPETVLGGYDIVFAKARSALEALAVGTAVVLVGANGLGPMVTASNVDALRRLNFGLRALNHRLTAARLAAEIDRYDPADAAVVSGRIRTMAGRDAVVDELVSLYRRVIAEWKAGAGINAVAEERAAAAYLRSLAPALKGSVLERQAVHKQLEAVQAQNEHLRTEVAGLRTEKVDLASRLSAALDTTSHMERSLFWKARLAWIKARNSFPL
jgi:hypothetical protein